MIPTRKLGKTDIDLPILSFGASSLGAEFRSITIDEAMRSTRTALDLGINFIDTSPFYGRGMSEIMLGMGLKDVPRDSYTLGSKLGRYSDKHFDFSAKRVEESVHISLQRLNTDYLDIMLLHDVEFVPLEQIWNETLPALIKAKEQGKVRAIGFSCYPLKTFNTVLDHVEDDIDCVLSYNRYTLQNTSFLTEIVPRLEAKGIGSMNAGPFSARLLTNAELPDWLKEPEAVKQAARDAAKLCADNGVDIAELALQFSCEHSAMTTTIAGSANPDNIAKWAEWLAKPIDRDLLQQVLAIFEPVKDIGHQEGLPENN
jgi:aryl-alcohol dehydrogenase-like predicted oxidoreductase